MHSQKNIYDTMPHQAQMLQLLIENARDYAIVMMDTEGRIALWNTGAENVMGWQEAEIVGQHAAVFFTPEDRAAGAPERELRTARDQGRAVDERWHLRKDGSRFWGSGLVFPVVDGELRGYVKIFRDLTESKRHEQELHDANRRLEAALNAGEIGTWTWDIASNRVFADKNLARFFSVSAEDANGGPIERYVHAIHPDDRAPVQATIAAAIQNLTHYEAEYRLVKPDGSYAWVIARGGVEVDAQGTPLNLPGVVLDITKRREAEQALRLSEEKYRLLLSSVDQGFAHCQIILDDDGQPVDYRFLEVNPAFEKMSGLVDAAGRTAHELVPNLEDWWAQTYGRVALTGESTRFEYGSEAMGRFFDAYATSTGQGRFVILFTDITARRKAAQEREGQIVEIEALNVRLARSMQETHHRIKNNLQVIAALVEIQAEELGDSGAVQRIKQHVRSLATIHDLLTKQAKQDQDTLFVRADTVLEPLIPMLQATSGDRRILADIAPVLLSVQKATSLSLLVSECVSNAIKHAKGTVEITLNAQEDGAHLEVCDDGAGFPPGFDPRKAANTGLELIDSTARWDLRGEVRYENREQGGGRVVVTFSFDAPSEA